MRNSSLLTCVAVFFAISLLYTVYNWHVKTDPNKCEHISGSSFKSGKHMPTIQKFISGLSAPVFKGDIFRERPDISRPRQISHVKDDTLNCTHWAVMTTIYSPSSAVQLLAADSTWCLVIAADTKTPKKEVYLSAIKHPVNVKFLTLEEQDALYPEISTLIPRAHFGRKNIGYLYAIHHGAKLIWDFDDDNLGVVNANILHENWKYLTVCSEYKYNLLNPYPYFVVNESYTWPRGIPLEDIRNKDIIPKLCQSSRPIKVGVVQSLANLQPDVDAIYRFTRDTPFNFGATTESHLPVVLPAGVYAPFNAQATLWMEPAFKYLALPISVHGRVSDIWRSYFTEFFLYRENMRLAFVPPYVTQYRNVHDILGDFNAENDIYQIDA
ncbi:hypothetical protein ACJMK2_019433 [Sinanodonta woodiana]|uniref:Uncharacterized protein n=1 Tax=Sinanodonta woodiana TaxID=1069815 RepID=A0ABD3UKE8_SINWO